MRARRLLDLFDSLEPPGESGAVSAVRVTATSRYRVGRDHNDDAIVLFELDENLRSRLSLAPIRLRHFEYEPRVSAKVRDSGTLTPHTSDFLILRCRDSDFDLRARFFEMLEGLVESLGETPSSSDLDESVHDLVELFRCMFGPSLRTISGLWAELLVLVDAANPEVAAAAWHSNPNEEHDFVLGNERVEVKSTTRPVREHEVTLGQLVVPANGVGLLVSVMLEPNDAGVTASDLLAEAVSRLPRRSEARRRLHAITAATIGEDWRQVSQVRFDVSGARASRRLYDAGTVPTVDPRLPPQVSRVRFTVDLSDTPWLNSEDAAARGTLPAALFDRRSDLA